MVLFSNTCRNVPSHRLHTQISVKGDDMAPKCEKSREVQAYVIITNISKHSEGYQASTLYAVSFNPQSKVGEMS